MKKQIILVCALVCALLTLLGTPSVLSSDKRQAEAFNNRQFNDEPSLSVNGITIPVFRSNLTSASFYGVAATLMQQDQLTICLETCDNQYNECQADQGVSDKTICHNNRTSCTNTCNNVYGPKLPKSPPPRPY
ncbi:MAG TPA: hypothetical protein VJT09_14270 [Pyrinomonadaceae bacterium]|nr:hypothetical protein [Pyrinomonadaceae bacterium]